MQIYIWSEPFALLFCAAMIEEKQARKSSEDAQAAGYARFENVWGS